MLGWCAAGALYKAHFYADQQYNPHALQMAGLYENETYCLVPHCWLEAGVYGPGPVGAKWPASRRLLRAYHRAFGSGAYASMRANTLFYSPKRIPVLTQWSGGTWAEARRAQVWAFRIIRAAALARWLGAVRVLLRRVLQRLGTVDIADAILAQLASWHAALPHGDALPAAEAGVPEGPPGG
jgi:hypothetical protein